MIYRIFNFISQKYNSIKLRYYRNTTKHYLLTRNVEMDFTSCQFPRTAKIHAEAPLHVGGGMTLGHNCVIDSNDSYGIYIGNNLLTAQDVYIRAGNHDYSYSELPFPKRGHCAKKVEYEGKIYSIVIEDNVWIGRGATILSGAHIGKGCVIGAGAVVKEVIPEYSIVIGNPAKIVSNRKKYPNFNNRDDIGVFI